MRHINKIIQFSKKHKAALQTYAYIFQNALSKNRQTYIYPNTLPEFLQIQQKHKINALALLSLENPTELCRFLQMSIHQLENAVNSPVYKHYTIKKKRGGERIIFAPEKQLKRIQKQLNFFLQAYYLWIKPAEVYGFVINPHYLGTHCNIVANANVHKGKKHILNIDLKDFFSSISAKRIKNLFTSPYFNYNEHMAVALTLLTTYRAQLPTGAPTSPVLSNFVCLELDAGLRRFCRENGLLFTRYADDLTFSSDTPIADDTILDIILLIRDNGFSINPKKLRVQSSNRRQTVTGLTVNEKVNVNRKLLKKIRAMLHDLTTNGLEAATRKHFKLNGEIEARQRQQFICRLKGYINFVGQVRGENDPVYLKLRQQLNVRYLNFAKITTR